MSVGKLNRHASAKCKANRNPFNAKRQAEYLASVCDPEEKKMIEYIWSTTTTISKTCFEDALRQISKALLKSLDNQRWVAVVGPPGDSKWNKSNFWVFVQAVAAVPKLKDTLVDIIGLEGKWTKETAATSPVAYVFFDDALYSGTQMSHYLFFVMGHIDVKPTDRLIVVTPFLSDKSLDKIHKDLQYKVKTHPPIEFFYSEKLDEQTHPANYKAAMQGYMVSGSYHYIMPHKIPDFMSAPWGVYQGFIPKRDDASKCPKRADEQLVPYIKGCAHNAQFVNEYGFKEFKECPTPPYKRAKKERILATATKIMSVK